MSNASAPLLHTLFSPHGRVSRQEYWVYFIVAPFAANLIVVTMASLFDAIVMAGADQYVGMYLALAVFFASWLSCAAGSAKRCHDRGRSGWWSLLHWGAVGVGWAIVEWGGRGLAWPGIVVFLFGVLVWFVDLGCVKGDEGPNAYGPDPLARPAPAPSHPSMQGENAASAS